MDLQPDLTVCILASNEEDRLHIFLTSLYQSADPVALETIIVDSSQNQGIREMLAREFPQVIHYELTSEASPVQARNHALRLAKGRYVSLWSDSLTVKPGCLESLINFLDDSPEIGAAGPQLLQDDGMVVVSGSAFPGLLSLLLTFAPQESGGRAKITPEQVIRGEVDWITSDCLVIRAEVIADIGLLDEKIFNRYADADFCRRARKTGWQIYYLPQASAVFQQNTNDKEKYCSGRIGDLLRFIVKKWAAL